MIQVRRHGADQDAGGTDPDDRTPAAEQVGNMLARPAKMMRRIRTANGVAMNIAIERIRQLSREFHACLRQAQNNGPRRGVDQLIHGSSPL